MDPCEEADPTTVSGSKGEQKVPATDLKERTGGPTVPEYGRILTCSSWRIVPDTAHLLADPSSGRGASNATQRPTSYG